MWTLKFTRNLIRFWSNIANEFIKLFENVDKSSRKLYLHFMKIDLYGMITIRMNLDFFLWYIYLYIMSKCRLKLLVLLLLSSRLTLGCYKFPADVRDPCLDKECRYGSKCRPSVDGRSAECTCVEKCATYGDSRGSRPVCGSDGRDYPNVCELERTACKESREITIKYQGHCGK